MPSLTPRINAIQWYEGMLLGPQHFQQAAIRHDILMCQHLKIVQPFFWGISQLTIDRVLLVSGKLRILELEALLPDGTVLSVLPTDTVIPEIDLTVYIEKFRSEGPLMVHLGIPLLNPNGSNVTGDFPRFLSVPETAVVDLNTGENPIYIPFLIPNITLIVSNTPPAHYTSFPLMEIEFINESYQTTTFLPPQTLVLQTSILGQVISNILQRLRDKAAFLSENIQSTTLQSTQPLISEYDNLLKVIVRQIPLLENLLGTNTSHPYALYQGLLELSGNLTSLKRGQVAPVFTPYQHNDLFKCFDQVISFIITMIDVIQENYVSLPFGKYDRVFSIELQPQQVDKRFLIAIRGTPSFGATEIINWVNGTLIASESFLKNVRDRRILGADRQVIYNDNDFGISAPQDGILLTVTNDPAFIKPGEPLCLINLTDTVEKRPQELTLYVKKT